MIKSSAPGSPERQEEQEATRLARGEAEPTAPRVPSPLARLPEQPSAVERLERDIEVERAIRGAPEPTEIGPVPVDILRLGRIISGLPRALRPPRRRSDQPQARTYPKVEQVIQQISTDALIPAEARGTPQADDLADARLVARDLARRLDIAQQQGRESIMLRLGSNYNKARDRSAIIGEIARIIRLIRDALPHQAVSVAYVDVYFGNRLATRVVLQASE